MDDVEKRLVETEARSKSNTKRLDKMEARQDDLEKLTELVARMQVEQGHLTTDVGEIKEDVKALKDRPAKWWEKLIVALIGAVVGYAVKALLGIG